MRDGLKLPFYTWNHFHISRNRTSPFYPFLRFRKSSTSAFIEPTISVSRRLEMLAVSPILAYMLWCKKMTGLHSAKQETWTCQAKIFQVIDGLCCCGVGRCTRQSWKRSLAPHQGHEGVTGHISLQVSFDARIQGFFLLGANDFAKQSSKQEFRWAFFWTASTSFWNGSAYWFAQIAHTHNS